jgi:hypothetical protein
MTRKVSLKDEEMLVLKVKGGRRPVLRDVIQMAADSRLKTDSEPVQSS